MATVDENQAKGGRILTYKDIVSDDRTIDVSQTTDDKLKLSSRIRTIDDFTEVNSEIARKLDYWDDFPDISNADVAMKYYNEDRTIVFTGTSNGLLRRGCYYKCKPDAEYSWVEPSANSNSDVVRFNEVITGIAPIESYFQSDPYTFIIFRDRDTGVTKGCLFGIKENNVYYVRMAVGHSYESSEIYNVYVYSSLTNTWSRHSDVNQYFAFNNTFIPEDSPGLSAGFGGFIRVHISVEGLNVNAFNWKQITQPAQIPLFPYDTVTPDVNNTCFLNPTSSCFFFGMLPSVNGVLQIKLDISNLEPNKFYGNNVIAFDTNNAQSISFVAVYNNAARIVNTVGSVDRAGKYKAIIEVVPDDTVTVIIKHLDTTTSGGDTSTAYCYGFRYNFDSPSPTVTRIELQRITDAAGNVSEVIKPVTGFREMPCHDFHRCLVGLDGSVKRLYKTNSLYLEDGKTYANLTGEDGDVCVEIPKTYLRITVPSQSFVASKDTGSKIIDVDGKKIPICDSARYEYNGMIDYLVSTSPIPDPPRFADGTLKTGVDRVIFNDVHPLFRVGGDYELDANGNYQYEYKYDYATGTMLSTNILLRKAADVCYAAAFASVKCYHSATNGTNTTLKVSATTNTEKVTPSGYFSDNANYPKQTCGLAMGTSQSADQNSTEARSVAPYKDGDMVGVSIPGVQVNIATADITKPALMPGGCSTVFESNAGESADPTAANTSMTYVKTLTFSQTDGSSVSKDYHLSWDGNNAIYALTTDDKFQSSKYYYTRTGTGTEVDPYKYTQATVQVGGNIPANTYYNATAKWLLTDGNKTLAESTNCIAGSVDFSSVVWQVLDGGSTVVAGVTMSTANKGAKVIIGPQNYGNRMGDSFFVGNTRANWDAAISYNPNWALNYRPAVSISRAVFQNMHGNRARRANDVYVLATGKFIDGLTYYKLSGGVYVVANDYTVGSNIPGNTYYTKEQTWIPEYPSNRMTIESLVNGVPYIDFNGKDKFTAVLGVMESASETAVDGVNYYERIADKYGTANSIYRLKVAPVGTSVTGYKLRLYPNTSTGTQVESASMWVQIDKDSPLPTFYGGREYFSLEYRGPALRWCVVKHTAEVSADGTYYVDHELAITDQNNNGARLEQSPWNNLFKDKYERYLLCYDIGYYPRNGFGPITNKFNNNTSIGFETGIFTCDDQDTINTNRTWYFTDSIGIQYKVAFDHASLRWKIYRRDTDWVAIYQSEPMDCCSTFWSGVTQGGNQPFMERRILTGTNGASVNQTSTTTLDAILYHILGGTTGLTFTFKDPALVPATGIVSAYKKYYTRTGNAVTNYVYTEANPTAGQTITEELYCMNFTKDIGKKVDPGFGTGSINQVYYVRSIDPNTHKEIYTVKIFSSADTWFEDLADGDSIYTRSDYTNRTWQATNGGYTYRIEYIAADDTRSNPDKSNPLNYDFGDCWAVVKYENNAVKSVVTTDMDILVNVVDGKTALMFRPLNSYARNSQRTVDATTGNTTNTSVVYSAYMDVNSTTYDYAASANTYIMFFVDENGNIPDYLHKTLGNRLASLISAVQSATRATSNSWIIAYNEANTNTWTIKAYSMINSNIGATTLNEEVMNLGPQAMWNFFTAVPGATDLEGNELMNNNRVLKFKNVNTCVAARGNARAFNCHTRLKQFMALMMVIDGGTFDTQSGISTGKSWLQSFDYARSTFCGRTATMGDVSGEIIWDSDVDINICYADWSSKAQSDGTKRVVAFNWRGFENPFGNIGECEDGIIPCTRFIDGHEVTGYYECINPGAYSDPMTLINVYKCVPTDNGGRTTIFSEYSPSAAYTWRIHEFPVSGWIKRWDPVTFLPTRAGGSSATYCGGYAQILTGGSSPLIGGLRYIRPHMDYAYPLWMGKTSMLSYMISFPQPGTRLQF